MNAAEAVKPDACPRVIGSTNDGRDLQTCGHALPCPYHGDPIVRIVPTPDDAA